MAPPQAALAATLPPFRLFTRLFTPDLVRDGIRRWLRLLRRSLPALLGFYSAYGTPPAATGADPLLPISSAFSSPEYAQARPPGPPVSAKKALTHRLLPYGDRD